MIEIIQNLDVRVDALINVGHDVQGCVRNQVDK